MCEITASQELVLVLDAGATRLARRFLEQAGCHAHHQIVLEDAQLLVAELVANGFEHGAPPVVVKVECDHGQRMRVAVRDSDPTPPQLTTPEPLATSGRGLLLVDYISTAWGVQSEANGKSIWFELSSDRRPVRGHHS